MQKHRCTSPIQLFQHKSQSWVAKVDAAIVGEQSDPIRVQHVQSIGNLVSLRGCSRFVIGYVVAEGDAGEEAEARWVGGDNLCSVGIHVAGQSGVGCERRGEARARGGDAEDGFGDAGGLSYFVISGKQVYTPETPRISSIRKN